MALRPSVAKAVEKTGGALMSPAGFFLLLAIVTLTGVFIYAKRDRPGERGN